MADQPLHRDIQIGDIVKLTGTNSSNQYVITDIVATTYPIKIYISSILTDDHKYILITEEGKQSVKSVDVRKEKLIDYQIEFSPGKELEEFSTRKGKDQFSVKGMLLTGIVDVDIQILSRFDNKSLTQICQVNRYTQSLCNNPALWYQKIVQKFGNILVNPDISLKDNYIALIKYPETKDGLDQASKDGNLPLMQWLIKTYSDIINPDSDTLNAAAAGGHLDIMKWLIEKYRIQPNDKRSIDILMVHRVMEEDTQIPYNTTTTAIKYGQTKILDWLNKFGYVDSSKIDKYIKFAIWGDQPESLQWLQSNDYNFDIDIDMMNIAFNSGSIKILELWRPLIIPTLIHSYNMFTGNRIISATSLTLTYMNNAISDGNIELVKFIMSLDPTITPAVDSISRTIINNHLDMIKYLKSLPLQVNHSTVSLLLQIENPMGSLLEPLRPSIESLKYAIKNGFDDIIKYYIETDSSILNSQDLTVAFAGAAQYGYVEMAELGLALIPPIYPDIPSILGGNNPLPMLQFAARLNPSIYPDNTSDVIINIFNFKIMYRDIDVIKFFIHMPNPIFPSEDTVKNLIKIMDQSPHYRDILRYIASDSLIPLNLRRLASDKLNPNVSR